jgi:hypothetical protein
MSVVRRYGLQGARELQISRRDGRVLVALWDSGWRCATGQLALRDIEVQALSTALAHFAEAEGERAQGGKASEVTGGPALAVPAGRPPRAGEQGRGRVTAGRRNGVRAPAAAGTTERPGLTRKV